MRKFYWICIVCMDDFLKTPHGRRMPLSSSQYQSWNSLHTIWAQCHKQILAYHDYTWYSIYLVVPGHVTCNIQPCLFQYSRTILQVMMLTSVIWQSTASSNSTWFILSKQQDRLEPNYCMWTIPICDNLELVNLRSKLATSGNSFAPKLGQNFPWSLQKAEWKDISIPWQSLIHVHKTSLNVCQ